MAETVYGNTSSEVEVFPVLDIVEIRALTLDEDGRRSSVGRNHVGRMLGDKGSAG